MKRPRPLPPNTKLYSEKANKAFSGARFDVYQWQQKRFDGSMSIYEIVKRNDTVIVIPVVGNQIVMVEEQQPHWENPALTMIAGMIKPDEDLELAARRKVEEETGMIFKKYHLVHIDPAVSGVEWFVYTFIATEFVDEKEKAIDPGGITNVMKFSIDTTIDMVRKKKFFYRPGYMEDMLMQGREKELRHAFEHPEKHALWIQ